MTVQELREQVRVSGVLPRAGPLVAMLSGGRDSVCLLDLAVAIRGVDAVHALHVNYALRADADGDEHHCRELCRELGVELEVVRAPPRPADAGNLQAWARELRYREAARLALTLEDLAARARTRGGVAGEYDEPPAPSAIATGHTASDQVETILYRLAASPGRRALLGMPAREGRIVRPLLELTREQTAAYCGARRLSWREDSSNDDEHYARSRVRHGLVPALRAVHPAAEANVLRTAQLLRAEAEVLEELLDAELAGAESIALQRLQRLPAALARLVVIRLAENTAGAFVPQAGTHVGEILALGRRGGRGELHVGGLLRAVVEDGRLRMERLPPGD
jgi:tRNA(Ile)-lysidine synthase